MMSAKPFYSLLLLVALGVARLDAQIAPASSPTPTLEAAPATPAESATPAMDTPAATPVPAASAAPAAVATPEASASPAGSPAVAAATQAEPAGAQEIVTRLQIFLDQQNFGPGIIDGRWGEFTGKALVHYARAHDMQITPAIYDQLHLESIYPIYTTYTITATDERQVGDLPRKPPEEAKMKRMPYPDLLTFVEERYHASPDFLQKLNPGMNMDALKAGVTLRVPNVEPFKLEDIKEGQILPKRPDLALRSVYIYTKEKMLDVYDGKKLIASFPITPGSTKLPAPLGKWEVIGIVTLPQFRWDEEMLEHGKRSADAYEIPPGPRNPVGVLWCGLDKTGIGVHGTNTPETIGRTGSHGCIRLANWDAIRFSRMVTTGTPVIIE